jgi:transposase
MTNEKKRKRPKYRLEFKQDAAKLVLQPATSRRSYRPIIKRPGTLGPSIEEAVWQWLGDEKVKLEFGGHDELVRLRKENEQLRMERERLKKAAVFFAKEAEYPQGTSKVWVYSGATEDVSSNRTLSRDAGEYQCVLSMEELANLTKPSGMIGSNGQKRKMSLFKSDKVEWSKTRKSSAN